MLEARGIAVTDQERIDMLYEDIEKIRKVVNQQWEIAMGDSEKEDLLRPIAQALPDYTPY